jgi:hypothetical protein
MDWGNIVSNIGAMGVGGWIGVFISNWMRVRRETAARAVQFREQQLAQFYGPLLALHNEIRARSELRLKLQKAVNDLHGKDTLHAEPRKTVLANVQDENETLRNILIPTYHEMIKVFRDKMWLAEPETREHFKSLIEFVDVWDKILADKLPSSVAPAIGHTEQNLYPFYDHLEKMHERLRSKVS